MDDFVGSELGQAAGPPREGGDVGARELAELDREAPDAAAGPGHEHALAEHEAADLERAHRRDAGDGQRRRLLEADLIGNLGEHVGAHRRELRPRSDLNETHDADPVRRPAAVRGRHPYDARHVPPRHRAGLHGGEARGLAAIEAEGPDLDERLVPFGPRVGHLAQLGVGRGGGGDECAHR